MMYCHIMSCRSAICATALKIIDQNINRFESTGLDLKKEGGEGGREGGREKWAYKHIYHKEVHTDTFSVHDFIRSLVL